MDGVELLIAVVLAGLGLAWRSRIEVWASGLARNTKWAMLAIGVLPVALRLALLAQHPIPSPAVSDDFSYLLLRDTLSHLRLANPIHPLHQFFETYFVLQEPSYSSIFPLGQGMMLAMGQLIFRNAWAGVAISAGLFCALCYWMLRGWTSAGWAFVGGVLAAIQFGPLNQWMNSYWGGAVSACAGCLVFGAIPRLREGHTRARLLLGIGLAVQFLTRPYEFLFLTVAVVVYLRFRDWIAAVPVMAALALTFCQNKAVTGNWTTLPYQLSRYQYGVPAAFTFEPNPVPHRPLTQQQQLNYAAQSAIHGDGTDTFGSYVERLAFRVRYYRFFFLPPLYLALPFFLFALVELRFLWVAGTLALFALGTNFYPYFYSHYIAAVTCLLVLVSVKALERLARFSFEAAQLIVIVCFAHFLFWYGLQAAANQPFAAAILEHETWDAINFGDPEGRVAINTKLANGAGKQLVFVRYGPRHGFGEWVHNGADIDGARVVWARDLGPAENEKLLRYYPDRTAWLVEPDARPPKLTPYERPP